MDEFKKHFEVLAESFIEGNLSSDDFFQWICDQIIFFGGKLPPKKDDETNPPDNRK